MKSALAVCLLALLPATAHADYLFTYFTRNGEDGLHLAWSTDGYRWEKLHDGRSFLPPTVGRSKLMRDPCVIRDAAGTYHLVWTSGWNENNIGHASTRDFLTWSAQQEIPVMAHEPTARNAWAPEVTFDPQRQEFILYWASTIPGRFTATAGSSETDYNHRMYFTTTKDFVTFTATQLFLDPGFNVIDATLLAARGRHYLILKDETRHPPKKHLQIAESDDVRGPFRNLSAPFTPPGLWVEGPTAIQIGGYFIVYYDAYQKRHYGAMRSRDLQTWEDVSSQLVMPDEGTPLRMRHGTVIEVPRSLIDRLRQAGSAKQ